MRYPTHIVAALVAAAMTCVCCTESDTLSHQPTASDMPIGFNAVVNHAVATRSVSSITSETFNEFDVWAFRADDGSTDGYVMGINESKGYQIQKNSKTGVINDSIYALGVWGYANKYQQTFWPSDGTQKLSFYALAPSTVKSTVNNLTVDITKAAPTFTYTAADNAAQQRDIIYAGKTVKLTDINRTGVAGQPWMSVQLDFYHALSQIAFDAHLESGYPELQVDIYSIEICNVSHTGTCTINASTSPATVSWGNWDTNNQSYTVATPSGSQEYTRLYTADGTTGNVVTPADFSTNNLLVIPQPITAWNTDDSISNTTGSYLKIRCNITQYGYSLLTEDYVYVPFAGTDITTPENPTAWTTGWKSGKKYTFHLEFGLGRNSSGKLNGTDITFTVSVGNGWTTGTVTDPEL